MNVDKREAIELLARRYDEAKDEESEYKNVARENMYEDKLEYVRANAREKVSGTKARMVLDIAEDLGGVELRRVVISSSRWGKKKKKVVGDWWWD